MAFAMFGFYVQSVCLHYATYSYVHTYAMDPDNPPGANKFAVLADPVEEALGEEKISIGALDLIAGFFPACFFALSVLLALGEVSVSDDGAIQITRLRRSASAKEDAARAAAARRNAVQLWAKVMLCAGCLFILKGVIGAATTLPDSGGWEICKARLKPEGVQWMKEEHTFWSMLSLDFQWNVLWYHHPLRYCSDMMYSGHTFVVTLFGLGLYELVRILQLVRARAAILVKMVLLGSLATIAVGEQVVEIYAVEKSRFHYTSDIIVALVMTFLMYTNGVVAIVSKKWSHLERPGQAKKLFGLHHLQALAGHQKADSPWDDVEDRAEEGLITNRVEAPILEKWSHLVSGGDIFIPPCCVPCCCYAGREHIYSDKQLKDLIDNFVFAGEHDAHNPPRGEADKLRAPLQEYLQENMNFSEGVSKHSFMAMVHRLRHGMPKSPA